jgi:hypothetical protein
MEDGEYGRTEDFSMISTMEDGELCELRNVFTENKQTNKQKIHFQTFLALPKK